MSEETNVVAPAAPATKATMSKETNVVAPAAPAIKAIKAKVAFKDYITTEKHTYPMDIQIRGEVLTGEWSAESGKVTYRVPSELTDGFEKHIHFVSGNIVAA
jgi:hypothetical protein